MANKPELSIKVSVDPILDREKLENDVQAQVSNIKNLPPVPIEPDTSGFKRAIEENIGGPYPVEITPTLTKNLTQQVNDEITAAQNGAQQLKVKLDVKEFGNDLSKQLKEQLRGVNLTLSNYLKEMQTNLALANKATYGLFGGGNRNVPVDSIFDEISKKDVKAVQTLTSQLDKVFEGLPKLKSAGKIDFENEIGSVEEFSSALSKMGTALQNMQAALNIYDQKQAKAAYSSAFDEFKKNYINVQGISDVLNGIVNNSSALKNLDIKGSAQLKNFLVSLTDGITAVSSVKDIDVNNFDNLISVLDPDKFGELATNISEVTSQISISTGESKKKLEELKKAEEEAMGAGVPIDPSILDANTKKIIESIGNVSAAMTELETKSKNFSDNLTVEVDKNVSNIESRIKQLTDLVKFLPNGEENLLEGEKPKNKPAKPKKQNVDLGSKPEDKPENDSNGSTATVNKITFDVDIDELQKAVDVLFAKISAPIGFKPADGAIANIKQQLQEAFSDIEINATNVNLQSPKTENAAPKYHILNKDELNKLGIELSTAACLTFTDYKQGIERFENADWGKKQGYHELEPHEISIELAKELGYAMKSYDNGNRNNSVIDIMKKYGAKTDNDGDIIDFEEFVKETSYKFFGPKNRNKITSQNAARLQEMLQSQDKEIQAYASFIEKLNSKLVETKQFEPRAYFDDSDAQFYYSLSSDEQNAFSSFQTKSYLDKFERNLHPYLVEPVDASGSSGYYFDDINTMVAEIYNLAQQRLIQSVGDLSGQTEVVKDQTAIPGKVTITDADVVVDVKNPVAIPGTVTVDPTSVQFGNSDDLQKNASALSSVKQSLNKISTSAEDYGTKIAAIGPSVQYVTQEVDNLSKSLENQITDLDLIAKKTDAYGITANSITLNTKDVAVAGDPVSIPVKATLEKTAITVPKEAVDIKVKGVLSLENVKQTEAVAPQKPTELPSRVTLSADDVVVPTAPVDIPGKGKKKNAKDDVKKPDVIDLKGKVELKDEDIKRPDPLKLNGAVKIKATDVKIDDVEISKKEFDIKGNLVLKNAEIASVIKEAVKKSKDTTPEKVTSQDISKDNKAVNIDPIEQNHEVKQVEQASVETSTVEIKEAVVESGGTKDNVTASPIKTVENKQDVVGDIFSRIDSFNDYVNKNEPEALGVQEFYNTISKINDLNSKITTAKFNGQTDNVDEWTQQLIEQEKKLKELMNLYGQFIDIGPGSRLNELSSKLEEGNQKIQSFQDLIQATFNLIDETLSMSTNNTEELAKRNEAAKEAISVIESRKDNVEGSDAYSDTISNLKAKGNELDDRTISEQSAQAGSDILSMIDSSLAPLNDEITNHAQDVIAEPVEQTEIVLNEIEQKFLDLVRKVNALNANIDTADATGRQDRVPKWILRRNKAEVQLRDYMVENADSISMDAIRQADETMQSTQVAYTQREEEFLNAVKDVNRLNAEVEKARNSNTKKIPELMQRLKKAESKLTEMLNTYGEFVSIEPGSRLDRLLHDLDRSDEKVYGPIDKQFGEIIQKEEAYAHKAQDDFKQNLNVERPETPSAITTSENTTTNNTELNNILGMIAEQQQATETEIAEIVAQKKEPEIESEPEDNRDPAVSDILQLLQSESQKNEAVRSELENKYSPDELAEMAKPRAVPEPQTQVKEPPVSIQPTTKESSVESVEQPPEKIKEIEKLQESSKEFAENIQEVNNELEKTAKKVEKVTDEEEEAVAKQNPWLKGLADIDAARFSNANDMIRARKNGSAGDTLLTQFAAKQTMYDDLRTDVFKGNGVKDWASNYFPELAKKINTVSDALNAMKGNLTESQIELAKLSANKSMERSIAQAKTTIANIKSQLMDYLEKFPKVEKGLAEPVQKLKAALADPNAYKNAGQLKQAMAELRAQAKSLGLESESLIDKFQKLFGQHLSTMITMAALHKMQDALRIVYQNVVEIDTAVTELRKVSEYAGKSLEEYMGRATTQAQKLGVSIGDYINSTADWKRLGYSDEDAENLATYSTLLKNVGDGIDDVNTSSSYLISTLQGFGLLADQAEDVVNKIDAVANTQPVTANDLGEILTRSSAAMSAANNTLEETIALGTAANAVIQDADTVGKVYADAA